jgi:hypothetical protein
MSEIGGNKKRRERMALPLMATQAQGAEPLTACGCGPRINE